MTQAEKKVSQVENKKFLFWVLILGTVSMFLGSITHVWQRSYPVLSMLTTFLYAMGITLMANYGYWELGPKVRDGLVTLRKLWKYAKTLPEE